MTGNGVGVGGGSGEEGVVTGNRRVWWRATEGFGGGQQKDL